MPIDKKIEPLKVKVFPLGWGHSLSKFAYDAEIVPYIDDATGELDPIVRRVDDRGRFLHLSTLLKGPIEYEYEMQNKGGGRCRFRIEHIIEKLYGADAAFDY
jgi:hypothetical protein